MAILVSCAIAYIAAIAIPWASQLRAARSVDARRISWSYRSDVFAPRPIRYIFCGNMNKYYARIKSINVEFPVNPKSLSNLLDISTIQEIQVTSDHHPELIIGSIFSRMTNLTAFSIDVRSCKATNDQLKITIGDILHNSEITYLRVLGDQFRDEFFVCPSDASKSISRLEIHSDEITSVAIGEISNYKNIRMLSLRGKRLSDDSLRNLHQLTKLRWLELDGAFTSDIHVSLSRCTGLNVLIIPNADRMPELRSKLRDAIPTIVIDSDPSRSLYVPPDP